MHFSFAERVGRVAFGGGTELTIALTWSKITVENSHDRATKVRGTLCHDGFVPLS